MDHLPYPENHARGPIEIPFVCTEDYDGGDFLTYPERAGWNDYPVYGWGNAIQEDRDSEKYIAFLQTWLFCGLIFAMFGKRLTAKDFQRKSATSNQLVISTEFLLPLVTQWLHGTSKAGGKLHRLKDVERSVECFQKARYLGAAISLWTKLPSYAGKIRLSIQSLESYLSGVITTAYEVTNYNVHPPFNDCNPIISRMQQDGWCPSDISRLGHRFGLNALHYLSGIGEPDPGKDHSRCTDRQCRAYQLDESTYRTRHVDPGCTCDHMVAGQDQLFEILRDDAIPLIAPISEQASGSAIEIISSHLKEEYIAISHVWADGLGNNQQNSLPKCQFLHIGRLVEALCKGKGWPQAAFWIDTICCPVKPHEATELAIAKMRDTYLEARAVLVLTTWLQSQEVQGLNYFEVSMRIFCSGWTRRLWCLQEGALSKELFFQFADKVWTDGHRPSPPYEQNFDLVDIPNAVFAEWQLIKGFMAIRNPQYRLLLLSQSFAWRSTSVSSDEALCLAALLNLNLMDMVQTPPKKRMTHLWDLLGSYPSIIIFCKNPRLVRKGHRWAPATLREPASYLRPFGEKPTSQPKVSECFLGHRTSDGLRVKFPGVFLAPRKQPIKAAFFIRLRDGSLYKVICHPMGAPENANNPEDGGPFERTVHNPWMRFESFCPDFLAIITSTIVGDNPDGHVSCGLLVSIERDLRKERGFLQVRTEIFVNISSADSTIRSPYQMPPSFTPVVMAEIRTKGLGTHEMNGKKYDVMLGERADDEQEWCVD